MAEGPIEISAKELPSQSSKVASLLSSRASARVHSTGTHQEMAAALTHIAQNFHAA